MPLNKFQIMSSVSYSSVSQYIKHYHIDIYIFERFHQHRQIWSMRVILPDICESDPSRYLFTYYRENP
jgi:hypothetical protein